MKKVAYVVRVFERVAGGVHEEVHGPFRTLDEALAGAGVFVTENGAHAVVVDEVPRSYTVNTKGHLHRP